MSSDFPREDAFDEDYLYFYEELLTPERTAAEVAVLPVASRARAASACGRFAAVVVFQDAE